MSIVRSSLRTSGRSARQIVTLVVVCITFLSPGLALGDNSTTLLDLATSDNNSGRVAELLDKGLDPNGNVGATRPLHVATEHGATTVLHLLLNAGADPNVVDQDGNTALHYAAGVSRGGPAEWSAEIIDALVIKGAKINARNDDGNTALHVVAGGGRSDNEVASTETASALLRNGADARLTDRNGRDSARVAFDNELLAVSLSILKELVGEGSGDRHGGGAKGGTYLAVRSGGVLGRRWLLD